MKNTFIPASAAFLLMLLTGSVQLLHAQDTLKKTTVAKKPAATRPVPVDPATGKPIIPINPKTGRPYTIYHGYVSNPKGQAAVNLKAQATADSLKKAQATASAPATPVAPATTPQVTATVDKSLNGQYQYLLTKVYNYQQPFVMALWKNVVDTLNADHHKLADAQAKITEQTKAIADLQAATKTADQQSSKADEITMLGISMDKSTYGGIMWGLVIVLAAVAGIVIARSGKYKHDANYRATLYNELDEEYKAYKSKANDKEKKLARELQTERNKVDELMGRG